MGEAAWTSSGLEVLGEKDFSRARLNRPGTVIVCFGAEWCPITRRFMPKFIAERGKLDGTLAIADITDLNSTLWDTFQIRITPSIVVFQNGEVHRRVDGKRIIGITASALRQLESAQR